MIRVLRPFLILLIALAFSVTSTGWSIASNANASSGGEGHHALSVASLSNNLSSGQHEHGVAQKPDCLKSDPTCGPKHQRSDQTSSCCATACHTAIPALGCDMTVRVFARTIDRPLLEAVLEEAPTTRLDRPPRSISL